MMMMTVSRHSYAGVEIATDNNATALRTSVVKVAIVDKPVAMLPLVTIVNTGMPCIKISGVRIETKDNPTETPDENNP